MPKSIFSDALDEAIDNDEFESFDAYTDPDHALRV
jgi:hypothetical protein